VQGQTVAMAEREKEDNAVEGLAHRELPIFSVQYHPESSPGPHDAGYLFQRFVKMMEKCK